MAGNVAYSLYWFAFVGLTTAIIEAEYVDFPSKETCKSAFDLWLCSSGRKSILEIPICFVAALLFCGHDTDKIVTCERHSVEREMKTGDENDTRIDNNLGSSKCNN